MIYDKVDELLYTEYADTMMLGFDPHYFSYVFGSDEVNIHGAGNIMPLIEHGGDLSLIKPYLKVIATAQMTTDGIINAPAKYRSELDRMYRDIIDMLKVLDVLK